MNNKDINKVGTILKKLRNEKGLKQDDLADMLNVKRQTYSAWERNVSNPDIETIVFLADFYGVNTDYILGRTDQRNSKALELPHEFTTPEEAIEFILKQNAIMGFGGFDINELSDEEVVEFANSLLEHLKLLSLKYKK